MSMTKRELLTVLGAALGAAAAGSAKEVKTEPSATASTASGAHKATSTPLSWHGSEQIAFLAYPGFTALDLVGPHYMLGSLMGSTTLVVAKTREPIASDLHLAIVPTKTFDECPADLDVICVPGGTTGTLAAMQDAATIAFLRERGARAKFVTSVCTGSLLLGAAGLLKGYKATSHWATRDLLPIFGAEPIDARVVTDRNRVTGAGVTAGLDFGLSIVARQRDADYARGLQLIAEYHPEPPFDAGIPETAGKATTEMIRGMFSGFLEDARRVGEAAARRL